jgi:hypothetical protein
VGGGDQPPLGLTGGETAAEEAVGAPDDFRVREDGLDDLLASAVERLPSGFESTASIRCASSP